MRSDIGILSDRKQLSLLWRESIQAIYSTKTGNPICLLLRSPILFLRTVYSARPLLKFLSGLPEVTSSVEPTEGRQEFPGWMASQVPHMTWCFRGPHSRKPRTSPACRGAMAASTLKTPIWRDVCWGEEWQPCPGRKHRYI